jgi:hypothetical protein
MPARATRKGELRVSELEKAEAAITAIIAEYQQATQAHGEFHSAHEGYAVLLEEVNELWEQVKRRDRDREAMRREAVQVGAMALRFLVDVCGEVS